MDYVNENARMSFYDEAMEDEMDANNSDSQLIDQDSGLGSMSRGKTISLTSMFSQFRTSPARNDSFAAILVSKSVKNFKLIL